MLTLLRYYISRGCKGKRQADVYCGELLLMYFESKIKKKIVYSIYFVILFSS